MMPGVSTMVHISTCLGHLVGMQPKSVLDVGCGFGLWGFLCREYLDAWHSRVRPQEWTTRIDAIEIFEPYISDHQRAIYDTITIADIRDAAPNVDNYDLIITGDIIEHLPKDDAMKTLETLYAKANKGLLVNIPLGDEGWDQGEEYGNPAEEHLSRWYPEDFLPFSPIQSVFELPNGLYGSFLCQKEPKEGTVLRSYLDVADYHERRNDLPRALQYAAEATKLAPTDHDVAILNTNLMIRSGNIEGAIKCLEDAIAADPQFHYAYLGVAKILMAANANDRARDHLTKLLTLNNIPPDIEAEARGLTGA